LTAKAFWGACLFMSDATVTIIDNRTGKQAEFPLLDSAHGPSAIDIRNLHAKLGLFTHDPGFTSTSSCASAITYVDGEHGMLLYRGYPIEQLAERSSFSETAYLLMYGELPTRPQLDEFNRSIRYHTMIDEGLRRFYSGYRHDAHPMAILVGVVGALAGFYHDNLDLLNGAHRELSAHRLIGKMPTITAAALKYLVGQPFIYPDNSLGYVENFMQMMFAVPSERYVTSPIAARALELILILHADHEQNASTSTVRLAGSSSANPFACIAAGIATLWGPAHGGANEAVIRMLGSIRDVRDIPKYIARAKDRDDPFRLMGFGHRIYKNYDPRAKIIRAACHDLINDLDVTNQPLFEVALELERIALSDDYFHERRLYPNVDFYSGIILKALGIPLNMFTAIFAVARTAGWISHWLEMMKDGAPRIGRPRQVYRGAVRRDYVPVELRT
jgi:citrate synthase